MEGGPLSDRQERSARAMMPAGYMSKRVESQPDLLNAAAVLDIYSVSGCVSKYFADYISYWKHNG